MKTNARGEPANICWMCGGTDTTVVDHETRYCKECGNHYATHDDQVDAEKATREEQIASAARTVANLLLVNNRISAGELRLMGLKLPETIPDCATIARNDIRWSVSQVSEDGAYRANIVAIDIVANFTSSFEWIELTVTL